MEYSDWSARLTFAQVIDLFARRGCTEVLVKPLASRQDNDKNQIYVGPDLSTVAKIPSSEPEASRTRSTKPGAAGRTKFQASVKLSWLSPDGSSLAPWAKLIYYPQYPEVRLSGFLRDSWFAPRDLLSRAQRGQEDGRLLLLGVNDQSSCTWGLVLPAEGRANGAVRRVCRGTYGVFHLWTLAEEMQGNPREELLDALGTVVRAGWLSSVRLGVNGTFEVCRGPNCGGYTLEAHLGIAPNGRAEPDYKGWELKQHAVTSLDRPGTGAVTLMTPEPTGGMYRSAGVEAFVRKNGYRSAATPDRWDFAGIHRVGMLPHPRTGTRLVLSGYRSARDFDPDGSVDLVAVDGTLAASWSFEKLIGHWRKKHAAACFVASINRSSGIDREYRFGAKVTLGEGATFTHLLEALASGSIYYDPGINLKRLPTGAWRSKRRSQFRVKFSDVASLYSHVEMVEVN